MIMHMTNRWCYILIISMGCIVTGGCASPKVVTPTTEKTHQDPGGEPTLYPRVLVGTAMGQFIIELDAERAPVTAMNFVDYVQAGYYNGTIFHRIIRNSVIQGGHYDRYMNHKTKGLRDPIISEWNNGLTNSKWFLGMVRIPNQHHSAVAEFFINMYENSDLDLPRDGAGYTVFGKVVDGFETLERMRDVRLSTHPKYAGGQSAVVPVIPVVISAMRMLSRIDREAARAIAEENQRPQEQRADDLIQQYKEDSGNEIVESLTGLKYIDLKVGEGASPLATEKVELYYRGLLADGQEFENSMEKSTTTKVERMIRGLQEGLLTMQEGGTRVLVVPPKLGYGEYGIPGLIPPNATLIFEIELLQIVVEVPKPFVPGKRN